MVAISSSTVFVRFDESPLPHRVDTTSHLPTLLRFLSETQKTELGETQQAAEELYKITHLPGTDDRQKELIAKINKIFREIYAIPIGQHILGNMVVHGYLLEPIRIYLSTNPETLRNAREHCQRNFLHSAVSYVTSSAFVQSLVEIIQKNGMTHLFNESDQHGDSPYQVATKRLENFRWNTRHKELVEKLRPQLLEFEIVQKLLEPLTAEDARKPLPPVTAGPLPPPAPVRPLPPPTPVSRKSILQIIGSGFCSMMTAIAKAIAGLFRSCVQCFRR